jgi:hypothetical protein
MTAKEPRPGSYLRFNPISQPTPVLQGPGQLFIPVSGVPAEVTGFQEPLGGQDPAEQELVDRVAGKLQAFYDGLPEDEQPVIDSIMSQAAAYAWSQSD